MSERSRGTILGAMSGDALGWPQELKGGLVGGRRAREARTPQALFTNWRRYAGNRFTGRYVDPVNAGEYSDDSQLLLSVARSCLMGKEWLEHLTTAELPAWLIYQRGGGGAVLAAAAAWSNGRPPWTGPRSERERNKTSRYLNAGANGVAMRIAPHVLYLMGELDAEERRKRLIARVLVDGVTTHGHPRALVGALTYACALDFAVNADDTIEYGAMVSAARHGLIPSDLAWELLPEAWPAIQQRDDFQTIWDETNMEMESLLAKIEGSLELGALSSIQETLAELGVMNPKIGGAGTITSAAAIFLCSRSAAKPMSALVSSAFQPQSDTDTLASMVGGLLGGIHGTSWLRELESLQDKDCAADLGEKLASKQTTVSRPDVQVRERTAALFEHLDDDDLQRCGIFPDGRPYSVESSHHLDGEPYTRFRLRLQDKQTVIIDRKSISVRPGTLALSQESNGYDECSTSERETPSIMTSKDTEVPSLSVFVTLPTPDLKRIADFYSRLLGRQLLICNGNVKLSPHVQIVQSSSVSVISNVGAALDLQVADLANAAEVLDESVRGTGIDRHVIGKDPDGRPVRVHQ